MSMYCVCAISVSSVVWCMCLHYRVILIICIGPEHEGGTQHLLCMNRLASGCTIYGGLNM